MNDRTEQWGPLQVHVKWEIDYNPDLYFLGTYANRLKGHEGLYVDRILGVICAPENEEFQIVMKLPAPPSWVYVPTEDATEYLLDQGWLSEDIEDEAYDPDTQLWAVHGFGSRVLVGDLPRRDRNGHDFFIPGNNHLADEAAFSQRDPESYQAVVAEFGSYEAAAAHWTAEDYERYEDYSSGGWAMMGCIVTVTIGGSEVGYDSLWSIPSDCSDDEVESFEAVVIEGAKAQAERNLDVMIA